MANSVFDTYQDLVRQARERLAGAEQPPVRIQIGSATCEHAAGARDVVDEFHKHIEASGRDDVTVHRVGCTGRCSREPIVSVFLPGSPPVKYEHVTRDLAHEIFTEHIQAGRPVLARVLDGPAERVYAYEALFCSSERCGCGAKFQMPEKFREVLAKCGVEAEKVRVLDANCFGVCRQDEVGFLTHMLLRPDNVLYRIRGEQDLERVVRDHILGGRRVTDLEVQDQPVSQRFFDLYGDVAFFNRQSRVALRNCGVVDPDSLDESLCYRGFEAAASVINRGDPDWVIEQLSRSNLRGRGGGGYPTGKKWAACREQEAQPHYIICNADEGDPGAFMDRSMLESDPFSIIEGMIIGGFAIGAERGFLYIRAEYPLAIQRIRNGIEQCRAQGLLGRDVLGSGWDFDLEIRLGAGAFVCGEETSLIKSIEGERGQPRIRPPYPSTSGLWTRPTVINNVETFANVAAIINFGAEWFARMGTARSGGTKVFALAGKICHTGLVEAPMGTPLGEVVNDIGGGVAGGKKLKAVQTGGPAGGLIPADKLDTPIDFETLQELGSIMGSGGMIVLDEDDCVVDVAKFYMQFSQSESCGKCTPCREGTKRMLEILERICRGSAEAADLDKLERLAKLVKKASLCGLGRAAPNPVLSTLEAFRDEYDAHVRDHRCPARRCKALVHYEIDPDKCVGCTLCARNCPTACISGERKGVHVIDQSRCIKCGRCFEVCRFDAVRRM